MCLIKLVLQIGLGFDYVKCVCGVFLVGFLECSSAIRVLIMVKEINLWNEAGF